MGRPFYNRGGWGRSAGFSLKGSLMRTHIFVVLDRSKSMQKNKDKHIEGLKALVNKQQNQTPEPLFTLVNCYNEQPFDLIYDAVPISHATSIELNPRGLAPLLDSVGRTISHAKATVKEDESPLFLIISDGQDNYSVEWDRPSVDQVIEEQKSEGWQFLYLEGEDTESAYASLMSASGCMGTVANLLV